MNGKNLRWIWVFVFLFIGNTPLFGVEKDISGPFERNVMDTVKKGGQPAGAEEAGRSFYIKIKAGYFVPSEETFQEIYGEGPTYGAELGFPVWNNVVLWMGGESFYKKGNLTYTGEETELSLLPIGGGLKYIVEAGGNLNFYGGVGLFYSQTEEKNPIGEVSDGGIGFEGMVGSFLRISGGLLIDLCLDYSYCKMKPADYSVDTGGLELSLGLGYEF